MKRALSMLTLVTLLLVPVCLFAVPVAEQDKPAASRIQSFSDLPPGAVPALVNAMLKDLPDDYQLKENGQTFSMANPSHGIKVTFTPEGPQINSGGQNWNISMSGIGYKGSIISVQEALLKNDAGRMVYERGNVSEWYINSRWGIEQGFTIQKAPEGKNRNSLVVELSLSGNLQPRLDTDRLVLADPHGRSIVQYTGLNVFDADSRTLPARLVLADNTLCIIVDDTDAKYPVTIDPLIQSAKLTASERALDDFFGWSVAISGDTIVVGIPGDDGKGAAYVFTKPLASWANMTQSAKLTASDGAAGDCLGDSVAINGDTVVVGAYGDENFAGSAYVFIKPATSWTNMPQTAKLTASDGAIVDFFGKSVAISGDTIVVGAGFDDGKKGSAYVFTKPVTGWVDMPQTAKLTASDGVADDKFGWSVAISGETVVVGAYGDEDKGTASGSAYVFTKPVAGWTNMTHTAKFTASDGAANDVFGKSVSISNDTIVVGASEGGGKGSAYTFTKPVTGWTNMTQTAKLTAHDGASGDMFGWSVSNSNDTIVVGARGDDGKGSAYVFIKPVEGWNAGQSRSVKLTASDVASGDWLGHSVAISDNTIVVGAPEDDDKGSAYVYVKKKGSWAYFPWVMFNAATTGTGATPSVCDSGNLHLCKDQTSCENAGGYWYNNMCNKKAPPYPGSLQFNISGLTGLVKSSSFSARTSTVTGRAGIPNATGTNTPVMGLDVNGNLVEITNADLPIKEFLISQSGEVYIILNSLYSYLDPDGNQQQAIILKVNPNNTYLNIDNTLVSITLNVGNDYIDKSVQFDASGNIYYAGITNSSSSVFRKNDGNSFTNLINDNIGIHNWLVTDDGTTFIQGTTTSTGTKWFRKIRPNNSLANIIGSNSSVQFISKFPDNKVYFGEWGKLFGVSKILPADDLLSEKCLIGGPGGGAGLCETGSALGNDYEAPDTCTANGLAHPSCALYDNYGSHVSDIQSNGTSVFAIVNGFSTKQIWSYYPTVEFLDFSIIDDVRLFRINGTSLIVYGLNNLAQNKFIKYDLTSTTETDLLPSDDVEIYHINIRLDGKIWFDGLRFSNNTYVIGYIDTSNSNQVVFLQDTSVKLEDFQTF